MNTLCRNGLKGQEALSPGQRPGYKGAGKFALKGQKLYLAFQAVFTELPKVKFFMNERD